MHFYLRCSTNNKMLLASPTPCEMFVYYQSYYLSKTNRAWAYPMPSFAPFALSCNK